MAVIHVDFKNLSKALREHVHGKEEGVRRAIRQTVKTQAPAVALRVVEGETPKPVDRGGYRRGFKAEDTPTGAIFYNNTPYAGVIEDGRRIGAKAPPTDVIEAWVRRKLRVSIKEGTHERMSGSQYRQAAFLIARAIKRRGLPAHKIMAKVYAQLFPRVVAAIEKVLKE